MMSACNCGFKKKKANVQPTEVLSFLRTKSVFGRVPGLVHFTLKVFFLVGKDPFKSSSNILSNHHCGSLFEENSESISTSISVQKVNEVYSSGISLFCFS